MTGFALIPIQAAATFELDDTEAARRFALIPIQAAATSLAGLGTLVASFALIPIQAAATWLGPPAGLESLIFKGFSLRRKRRKSDILSCCMASNLAKCCFAFLRLVGIPPSQSAV